VLVRIRRGLELVTPIPLKLGVISEPGVVKLSLLNDVELGVVPDEGALKPGLVTELRVGEGVVPADGGGVPIIVPGMPDPGVAPAPGNGPTPAPPLLIPLPAPDDVADGDDAAPTPV